MISLFNFMCKEVNIIWYIKIDDMINIFNINIMRC